ncbi:MAG: 5-oxoprolinase [Actinomycetota bacterium]|nr:MAG: 5-oxoprolinase [Actinomycetota bacterium]
MPARGWIVGIDVGGTFTDGVAVAPDGELRVAKVPSTPADPSVGLLDCLRRLREGGVDRVDLLFHGTTVATNAVLTGVRSRVVLLATEGFRDILSYRTGSRPKLYDLMQPRPDEMVPRRDRIEVRERLSSLGEIVVPLTPEEIDRVVEETAARSPEAVAVAFLFSYLNDRHERAIGRALRARLPEVPVTLSSEVAREFREYPRTATAVVNAALRPVVGRYVRRAAAGLRELGVDAPFLVMQSNGGCVPAERADREAHRLILSGPAAGVAGALALAGRHGLGRVIAFDMGGTSLDVCLAQDGVPPVTPVLRANDHPILAPSVDIVTVGAGGGSIASVDRAGRLRVGPESAGADPGPAAYGRGGTAPTLTDAFVAAGVLGPETPLAGELPLDVELARGAVARVGEAVGLDLRTAAEGIIAIAAAHAARALRRVSVERGIDPREFVLVAFGGAGPLLAGWTLEDLGLRAVLVPPLPGLFSAQGLMSTSLRIDGSQTVLSVLGPRVIREALAWFDRTGRRLLRQLREDGVDPARARVVGSVDCRYLGQGYELSVPLPTIDAAGLRAVADRFHELHARTYGHADPSEPVEIVTLRLSAFGDLDRPPSPELPRGGSRPRAEALAGERKVHLRRTGRAPVPVYRRSHLRAGNRLVGPAIVDQMDATTLILAGQSAEVDRHGNLWIRRSEGR